MALTDVKIKAAKVKKGQVKMRFTDERGLSLVVHKNGSKKWEYRYSFLEKRYELMLGEYPLVSLQDARKKRDKFKLQILDGINPKEELQQKRKEQEQVDEKNKLTFKYVATAWCQSKLKWSEPHRVKVLKTFENYLFPIFGDKQIETFDTQMLLVPIKAIEMSGKTELATRLTQRIKSVFTYAIWQGYLKYNPAQDIGGVVNRAPVVHRATINFESLPSLINKINQYEGDKVVRLALEFTLLTFVRSSELRFARWNEVDFKRKLWTIPGVREEVLGVKYSYRGSKMKTPHVVPLSSRALEILLELFEITKNSTFIFASGKNLNKPLSENTLNKALRLMGYSKDELCLHGFRALACSSLVESGHWMTDIIERQMSHQERSSVRAAYIHKAEHLKARSEMMQWWEDYLTHVKSEFIMPYELGRAIKESKNNNTASKPSIQASL